MPQSPAGRARHLAGLLGIVALSASVFAFSPAAFAAQGPVGLATATSFAVLAGSGITNTGATTITGDVGTFPTTSETGFGSITLTGTDHAGDAVTQGAKTDLVTAYDDAAGRGPTTSVPVELGGSTLQAGVYGSPTFGLTGTLTLDAAGNPNATFIFQAASTLITETNSQVRLINGADACNVFWQVGSSATFKAATQFAGTVLALTSISADQGATFQGRLLARNGAVTLINNVITEAACATPTPSPTASPLATSVAANSPTSTPATPRASAPGGGSGTTPPRLPFTGAHVLMPLLVALTLLTFGAAGLVAGRRNRRSLVE